jgi:hypothetical protein
VELDLRFYTSHPGSEFWTLREKCCSIIFMKEVYNVDPEDPVCFIPVFDKYGPV